MKTVAVLILGWLIFDSVLTLKNMLGMALAVVGMIVYSWAVENAKQQAAKAATLPAAVELAEEDISLLKSEHEKQNNKLDVEIAIRHGK